MQSLRTTAVVATIVVLGLASSIAAQPYFHQSFHGMSDSTCGADTIQRYLTWANDTCESVGSSQSFKFLCLADANGGYTTAIWSYTAANCEGAYSEGFPPADSCTLSPVGYAHPYCDDNISANTTVPLYATGDFNDDVCTSRNDTSYGEMPTDKCLPSGSSNAVKYICNADRTVRIITYGDPSCGTTPTSDVTANVDDCVAKMSLNLWSQQTCNNFVFFDPPAAAPVRLVAAPEAVAAPQAAAAAPQAAPQAAPLAAPQAAGNTPQTVTVGAPVMPPASSSVNMASLTIVATFVVLVASML